MVRLSKQTDGRYQVHYLPPFAVDNECADVQFMFQVIHWAVHLIPEHFVYDWMAANYLHLGDIQENLKS